MKAWDGLEAIVGPRELRGCNVNEKMKGCVFRVERFRGFGGLGVYGLRGLGFRGLGFIGV